MSAYRIISCKLHVEPHQAQHIEATLKAFADACNYIADRGREAKVSSKMKLQKLTYYDVRERFGLSANLAIAATRRVSAAIKSSKTRDVVFRPTSVDYDARTFSFREHVPSAVEGKDFAVSLTLPAGRERFHLDIGEWQRDELRGQNPKSAVLVKKPGGYFLDIRIRREQPPEQQSTAALGVDLGVKNIATLSTGAILSSDTLNAYRLHRHKVRKSIQSKAAKGKRTSTRRNGRRLLRALSGKERRRSTHENHVISRRIVDKAKLEHKTIVLEDLSGIRDRTNRRLRKSQRGLHNKWSFYQLRQFIEYKAADSGVPVVVIKPAYTSKTCSGCYRIGKRRGDSFDCPNCGRHGHADVNAARRIAAVGASVSGLEESAMLACGLP